MIFSPNQIWRWVTNWYYFCQTCIFDSFPVSVDNSLFFSFSDQIHLFANCYLYTCTLNNVKNEINYHICLILYRYVNSVHKLLFRKEKFKYVRFNFKHIYSYIFKHVNISSSRGANIAYKNTNDRFSYFEIISTCSLITI